MPIKPVTEEIGALRVQIPKPAYRTRMCHEYLDASLEDLEDTEDTLMPFSKLIRINNCENSKAFYEKVSSLTCGMATGVNVSREDNKLIDFADILQAFPNLTSLRASGRIKNTWITDIMKNQKRKLVDMFIMGRENSDFGWDNYTPDEFFDFLNAQQYEFKIFIDDMFKHHKLDYVTQKFLADSTLMIGPHILFFVSDCLGGDIYMPRARMESFGSDGLYSTSTYQRSSAAKRHLIA
uniref:AAA-ATPase_like domain-containing protein n=1 Tax=Panagrellus redivivus TaxID=6233 RepID=A0A7E4W743_PANRE